MVGHPVNGQTVTVTGLGEAGETVTLFAGGSAVGTGKVDAGGVFTVTTTPTFVDGTYQFAATETDSANLTSALSKPLSVGVASLAPTRLAQKGTATNGGTIEITGVGDAAGDTIKLYEGATIVGSGKAGLGGAFDIVTNATFADDTYGLTATDTSADGTQTSGQSAAATAIVGSVAPTGLAQKGIATNNGTIEITGVGDASGDTITLYEGATLVGSGKAGAGGAFDIVTTATFADGTHSLTAKDTSTDGTETSGQSTAATAIVGSVAPTGLAQKGIATNNGTIEITGVGDASGDTITLYEGATLVGSGKAGAGGAFDIVTSATFADGTHNLTATDTSADGTQTSAKSNALTANVDPNAPAITALVGTPLTNQTVELKGSGEVGDTINLYADGNVSAIVGTGIVGAGGTFDIVTTATFGDGSHTFIATETDAANLTSAASAPPFAVSVGHVPPTVIAGATVVFTQNGAAADLDSGIAVSDPDSGGLLAGATVRISSGLLAGDTLNFANQNGITGAYDAAQGVLTLTGTASVANYRAALASITFNSSAINPSNSGADLTRTLSWTVTDGNPTNGVSATATSTVDIHAVPTVVAGGAVNYLAVLDPPVTLDPSIGVYDGVNLTGASVKIGSGFVLGDFLFANTGGTNIHASYNVLDGVLTLSGADTLAHYDQVLQNVKFSSSQVTSGSVTIDWQVTDQSSQVSALATSQVNVTGIFGSVLGPSGNSAPVPPGPGAAPFVGFFHPVTDVQGGLKAPSSAARISVSFPGSTLSAPTSMWRSKRAIRSISAFRSAPSKPRSTAT